MRANHRGRISAWQLTPLPAQQPRRAVFASPRLESTAWQFDRAKYWRRRFCAAAFPEQNASLHRGSQRSGWLGYRAEDGLATDYHQFVFIGDRRRSPDQMFKLMSLHDLAATDAERRTALAGKAGMPMANSAARHRPFVIFQGSLTSTPPNHCRAGAAIHPGRAAIDPRRSSANAPTRQCSPGTLQQGRIAAHLARNQLVQGQTPIIQFLVIPHAQGASRTHLRK